MRVKIKTLLVAALCLTICALLVCFTPGSNYESEPSESPAVPPPSAEVVPEEELKYSSFDEHVVEFPRIAIHAENEGRLFYITMSQELADECQNVLENGTKFDDTVRTGAMLYLQFSETEGTSVGKTVDGHWGIGNVEAPETAAKLVALAEEATGWDFDADILDFSDLTKIEVYFGDELIHTVTDSAHLTAVETVFQGLVSTGAPQTSYLCMELRGTKQDGTTISVMIAPDTKSVYLPPAYHFTYYGDQAALREALGIKSWPDDAYNTPLPEGFLDNMYLNFGLTRLGDKAF